MKKYQQLFKQIQENIQNETYAIGEFLPSEHDLMIQYHVSRDTVRKGQFPCLQPNQLPRASPETWTSL